MKKRNVSLICLLLALVCLLTACEFGEYNGIETPSGQATIPPVTNSQGVVDENPFTVTLMYNGEVFPVTTPIDVKWSDGYSVHTAPVGQDGVARIAGLDGDYRVTLSTIPAGYGYNPNAVIATNGNRNVTVELYKLIDIDTTTGYELYDCIITEQTGVYCLELTEQRKEIFFQFAPRESGVYTVESWLDIAEDEINPIANYYGANIAFKQLIKTQNDGGPENSYTKNFVLEVEIADEMISKTGTGAVAFTFGITGTHREGEYPIKIYFAIKRDKDFDLPHETPEIVGPKEVLVQQPDYDKSIYEFVHAEGRVEHGSLLILDADNYKLWKKEDGGDNYYHVYDPVKYQETGGYGPILYAKVSQGSRFVDALNSIEYAGNKALTYLDGDGVRRNHKMFFEGWSYLNYTNMTYPGQPNTKPPYFCDLLCPCRVNKTCDSLEIAGENGTCALECQECLPTCNKLARELIGAKGYANYTNSDGCYAVTEELKDALQYFCISQLLFMDGDGFAETDERYPVFATEDDQWLFACGYYDYIED